MAGSGGGRERPSHVVVPLMAYGERAGDLLYTEPATPLRPADRRVLEDLAAQLALLLHARALSEDSGARGSGLFSLVRRNVGGCAETSMTVSGQRLPGSCSRSRTLGCSC